MKRDWKDSHCILDYHERLQSVRVMQAPYLATQITLNSTWNFQLFFICPGCTFCYKYFQNFVKSLEWCSPWSSKNHYFYAEFSIFDHYSIPPSVDSAEHVIYTSYVGNGTQSRVVLNEFRCSWSSTHTNGNLPWDGWHISYPSLNWTHPRIAD